MNREIIKIEAIQNQRCEYDHGITVDQWKKMLIDESITSSLEINALCKMQLSPYRITKSSKKSLCDFGELIQKKLNIQLEVVHKRSIDSKNGTYFKSNQSLLIFAILIPVDEKKVRWQLRPELAEAITELNLVRTNRDSREIIEVELYKNRWCEYSHGITVDQWKELLIDKDIVFPQIVELLYAICSDPEMLSNLNMLTQKKKVDYLVLPRFFGRSIQKKLNIQLEVITKEGRSFESLSNIAILMRQARSNKWKWELLPELLQALLELDLISNTEHECRYWLIPSQSTIVKHILNTKADCFYLRNTLNLRVNDILYIGDGKTVKYKVRVDATDIPIDRIDSAEIRVEISNNSENNSYCKITFINESELELKKLLGEFSLLYSGVRKGLVLPINNEVKEYLDSHFILQNEDLKFIDEVEQPIIRYTEGRNSAIVRNSRNRSRDARMKCIEQKGVVCSVCGFDFEKVYGVMGKGFIHVHHTTPLAERGGDYEIDIESDLVPVCPNCHAMLHKEVGGRYLSVKELSDLIR